MIITKFGQYTGCFFSAHISNKAGLEEETDEENKKLVCLKAMNKIARTLLDTEASAFAKELETKKGQK